MAIRKSASKSPVVTKAAPAVITTPVRNSAVPPKSVAPAARKAAPTYEQIARRAYEISESGTGGSQDDNWHRAERELRGV